MQGFVTKIRTDLNGALPNVEMLDGMLMTGDQNANYIQIELTNDYKKVVVPQGTKIIGYFFRSDGQIIETTDSECHISDDGEVMIKVPDAAYTVPGMLSISVRMFEDPVTKDGRITWKKRITIASIKTYVKQTI